MSQSPPMRYHVAHQIIGNIGQLPTWVKQVIFLKLMQELSAQFSQASLQNLDAEDTLAFLMPQITLEGEKMLLDLKSDVGKLLMDAKQHMTVLDICLHHRWTLADCCFNIMEAIQSHWVHPPASIKALGTIEYLANKIRLGEYLVKMNRITVDQLEQALRTQQYIKEAMHEHTGLANILINLGFITRQDTDGILFLKEESCKPIEGVHLFEKLL